MLLETLTDETIVYQTAAALVAFLALYAYLRSPSWVFGPQARFWNPLRRVLVPVLDAVASRHLDDRTGGAISYAQYELDNSEHVGRVEASVGEFERELYDGGFKRLPLAALKSLPDGRIERGSWARRDGLLAERQTHVMLFESPVVDSGVDVYAHEEPNAINPATAWKHYQGIGYSPSEGVETMRAWLDDSGFEWTSSKE